MEWWMPRTLLWCCAGRDLQFQFTASVPKIIPKSWNKTLAQNFSNLQFVSIASIISVNTITAINKDQMNMRWEENGFVCKRTSRTCSRLQMSSNQTGLAMFTLISKAIQAWPVGYSYAGGNFAHAFGLFLGCCWLWYKQVCCKTLAARHSFPFTKLCLNEASKSRVDWDPLSVPTQIPKIIAGWISAWVYVLAEFVISCHFDSFASELAGELVGRPRGHIPPLSTTEFAPKQGGCACSKPWFSPHVQDRMNDMHCPPILLSFRAFIHYPLLCSSLINLINFLSGCW